MYAPLLAIAAICPLGVRTRAGTGTGFKLRHSQAVKFGAGEANAGPNSVPAYLTITLHGHCEAHAGEEGVEPSRWGGSAWRGGGEGTMTDPANTTAQRCKVLLHARAPTHTHKQTCTQTDRQTSNMAGRQCSSAEEVHSVEAAPVVRKTVGPSAPHPKGQHWSIGVKAGPPLFPLPQAVAVALSVGSLLECEPCYCSLLSPESRGHEGGRGTRPSSPPPSPVL